MCKPIVTQASLQRLKNDVLLALIEEALNLEEPDIEKATEAYDKIIRTDKDRNVRKAKEIFAHADIKPIPWLAQAKESLNLLERFSSRSVSEFAPAFLHSALIVRNVFTRSTS